MVVRFWGFNLHTAWRQQWLELANEGTNEKERSICAASWTLVLGGYIARPYFKNQLRPASILFLPSCCVTMNSSEITTSFFRRKPLDYTLNEVIVDTIMYNMSKKDISSSYQ